jgi:4,5-DOPA dioxygenase extradiol
LATFSGIRNIGQTIMNSASNHLPSSVLYLSHGGGPLPLLGDKGHQNMINIIKEVTPTLVKPAAILVISAHWQACKPTITSGANPSLIYDYYGFPKQSYEIKSNRCRLPEIVLLGHHDRRKVQFPRGSVFVVP